MIQATGQCPIRDSTTLSVNLNTCCTKQHPVTCQNRHPGIRGPALQTWTDLAPGILGFYSNMLVESETTITVLSLSLKRGFLNLTLGV